MAAVASCAQARARRGRWLVRIEDLDPPREVPGAADHILRTLDAYGMRWDGPVVYQSRRAERYGEMLGRLRAAGLTYPCGCSRREIAKAADAEHRVYPGTCRSGLPPGKTARAVRLRVPAKTIAFEDALQGRLVQDLETEVGDFVLHRADGYTSYQLAVVVDDAEAGITEVVRGADLLDSTPRQILLQQLLSLPTPQYAHVPVAVNELGDKLSKQTGATALDLERPGPTLYQAFSFLGHTPPSALANAPVAVLWEWALEQWQLARVPAARRRRLADPDQRVKM